MYPECRECDKSVICFIHYGIYLIKYYTDQNTPVYTCLLDASKAFDRVNHWTLFAKLIESHAPLLIVRILLFWYQMQQVCMKWGKSLSQYFTICNGIK